MLFMFISSVETTGQITVARETLNIHKIEIFPFFLMICLRGLKG